MSEALSLLMAQVDDVPGETLGAFVERAEALGARNVQIVASVTKKGRPGYLVYLDVPAALEGEAGLLLGAELGCWGYRVLAAEHRHFDITRLSVAATVTIDASRYDFTVRAKTIGDAGRVLRVKAEHDDLVAACAALRAAGHDIPLAVLKSALESRLQRAGDCQRLEVTL